MTAKPGNAQQTPRMQAEWVLREQAIVSNGSYA